MKQLDLKTTHWWTFILGTVLGGLSCAVLSVLPSDYTLESLALILVAVSAVYFGTAISENKREIVVLETLVTLVFIALALLGRWYSPLILALGYFLHGLWDYLHHSWQVGATVRSVWYPPFCMGYDWLIAIFIPFAH
ncbi:hypothetical protein C1752_08447 [Acaryochloris thomasi RCC1774]|uniref:Uncharacterized protein n=1 Tax=Acaryochloris thomasi RCC1774 TaxID=1764569 RepID=A0A2W1JHE5_9CYAN|nr:DUF6010 family protein [Acaryochloris thomasi]PZD71005.1 hypothetical protein C1752_08447 [Acaryochloris thomasi RCC1774]